MPRKPPPPGASWLPAKWEPADAAAIQALSGGLASPEQQRRALDWIITAASGTYELSFQPDSEHATSFAEGRRFVGLQIVKLMKVNLGKLRQAHGGQPSEQQ